MTYPDKFVHQVSDVPDTEHWVIVKTDGVFIPGDERSRTNPGHGYPERTQNFLSYNVYFTEAKLLEAIEELEKPQYGGNRTAYKVLRVTPVKVKTEMKISVG
jgi:hypothetical protein